MFHILLQNVYIHHWNLKCEVDKDQIKVLIFSTVAMHCILSSSSSNKEISSGLDYVNKNGIFDYESLIVVANDNNTHWLLFEVKLNDNLIIIYDPADKKNNRTYDWQCSKLINFLLEEAKKINPENKNLVAKFTQAWNVSISSDMPKQENDHDCGMYVMLAMDRLVHHISLQSIEQRDIENHRIRIANMFMGNNILMLW